MLSQGILFFLLPIAANPPYFPKRTHYLQHRLQLRLLPTLLQINQSTALQKFAPDKFSLFPQTRNY